MDTLKDNLWIAFRYIKIRWLESLLIVLGIAMGVGIIACALGTVNSFHHGMDRLANHPYYRQIMVTSKTFGLDESLINWKLPFWKIGTTTTPTTDFELSDIDRVKKECPQVQYGFIDYYYSNNNNNFYFNGRAVTADFFSFYPQIEAASGRLISQSDIQEKRQVLLIGANIAKKLFPNVNPLHQYFPFCNRYYEIIGVLKPVTDPNGLSPEHSGSLTQFNDQIFIPYNDFAGIFYYGNIGSIKFTVADRKDIDAAEKQLASYFNHYYGADTVCLSTFVRHQGSISGIFIPLFTVIVILASAGLLIATVNILNLMLAREIRRSRTIGIAMALGASRGVIFRQFLYETLVLGVAGGLLGIRVAYFLAQVINNLVRPERMEAIGLMLKVDITWQLMSLSLFIALMTNLLFGIYPAYQAARTNPVEAVRMD